MLDYFVIVTIFNMGILWLRLWRNIWQPIFMKLINTGWTCTWSLTNITNAYTKLWINPVMIMRNNCIYSSYFEIFFGNWVPRKLLIIPSHVDIFMLRIFYFLNVIITVRKLGIFLSFVVPFIFSLNQR